MYRVSIFLGYCIELRNSSIVTTLHPHCFSPQYSFPGVKGNAKFSLMCVRACVCICACAGGHVDHALAHIVALNHEWKQIRMTWSTVSFTLCLIMVNWFWLADLSSSSRVQVILSFCSFMNSRSHSQWVSSLLCSKTTYLCWYVASWDFDLCVKQMQLFYSKPPLFNIWSLSICYWFLKSLHTYSWSQNY